MTTKELVLGVGLSSLMQRRIVWASCRLCSGPQVCKIVYLQINIAFINSYHQTSSPDYSIVIIHCKLQIVQEIKYILERNYFQPKTSNVKPQTYFPNFIQTFSLGSRSYFRIWYVQDRCRAIEQSYARPLACCTTIHPHAGR